MVFRPLGILLTACLTVSLLSAKPARADDIHLLAAASLQPVLSALIAGHNARIDGNRIIGIFASSGALARQIAQGAPADLFISANPRWADWLMEETGLQDDSAIDLLANRLVLVVPLGATANRTLRDFAESGRLMLGDPTHVPAGQYAKQALEKLGIWDAVSPRLVFGSNVRTAVAFAERGEVDGAIVYRSDALASAALDVSEVIDAGLHDPVVYRSVLLSEDAKTLLNALQTPEAAAMFRRYGFDPLTADQ